MAVKLDIQPAPAEIAKLPRIRTPRREPIKWEEILTDVRADAGQAYQIVVADSLQHAQAARRDMKKRLRKVCPAEKWTVRDRDLGNLWAVFARFDGLYSPEELEKFRQAGARLQKGAGSPGTSSGSAGAGTSSAGVSAVSGAL